MNVTFLINSLNVGGAEKVCVTLSNGLVNRNLNVGLIIVHPSTPLEVKLDKRINVKKLNQNKIYKSILGVIKTCRNLETDSLMVFDPELYVLAHISKILFKKKYKLVFRCINTLSKSFELNKSKKYQYINKPIIKLVLRYAKYIVAQSSGMKSDLVKSFKVDQKKVKIIPNPAIVLNSNQEEISKDKVILFVGRIAPQKGLDMLFNAFKEVVQVYPKYKLLIVGKGQESFESKMKTLVADMNLTDSIIFEGNQSNVSSYYKKAKLTVLTSLFEGFPNVLVESISLGTPVVSFNCESGPIDIIENGKNGYLVPMSNVEEFAAAVTKIIANPIDKEIVLNTAKKFSAENIIDKYEKLLIK